MKNKITILLLVTLFIAFENMAQSNYSYTNASISLVGYTDISSTGAAITMSDPESGNSVAPINIGFNFIFNGTVFSQCMIHADGILRFGTAAPGSHTSLFTNNSVVTAAAFTTTNAVYQNVVLPFFMDLVQGSATPIFHVLTEGVAPNRITTVQWKNLKDNNNAGFTTQNQFDNLEFQVKLFETSNNIQLVYGSFIPSANTVTARNAQVGIKASATSFIGVQKATSTNLLTNTEFFDPVAHSVFNVTFPVRKSQVIPAGFSYVFYGRLTTDINIAEAYVDTVVAMSASASRHNRVRIKNEGTTVLSAIDVTMQVTGANTFSQTINVASLAAGAEQVIDFAAYAINNTGQQQINFTAAVAGDERPENNTVVKTQTVSSSFVQPFADSKNNQTGVGFNGIANNELAIKIYSTGAKKISQIRLPFGSYISNVTIKILDDDGAANIPGTLLHTSPAFNTSFDNELIYNISTPVLVTGDYYISVRQNNTNNMTWMFALQYPIHPDRMYNGNGISFTLQNINRGFQGLIKVVEESGLPDVGIAAITSPSCNYGSAEPVNVSLKNFSSVTHDFSVNPVTISGNAVNSKTNTPIPFAVVKNTGTLAPGAAETVTVIAGYDFTERAIHSFTAKTAMVADAETLNDSIGFRIVNSLRNTTTSFTGAVCPFTPVTITAVANVFSNIQWTINGNITSGNAVSFAPQQTTVVKVTANDYRGCVISDSIIVPVSTTGLPPTPVITYNDTLLRYSNGFSDTLSVSALTDHTVNWQGSGTVINGGLNYVVKGFRGQNPEPHLAYYRNNISGCGSNAANITTRFGNGILMDNNTDETVCDTSFYDAGGAMGNNQGSNNFTKTFYPATPGAKIKLSIYNIVLGQFSIMNIYDGINTSAPNLDQLDRFTPNALREYAASNNAGAITVSFTANSSTASGWLAGITCQMPLQFRSVQNGLFTNANTWESKLPASSTYSPATRVPSKGDDSIFIRHAVSVPANMALPLDQTVIESTGTLTVPANSYLSLFTDNPGYEMLVNGTLTVNGNIYGSPSSATNGKIALAGTLNLSDQLVIDSVVIIPAAAPAVINASGAASISKLQVNNPFGVNLNGNLNISRALDLKNGLVNVAAPNFIKLVSGLGPVIQGGSATSYVNGKLRQQTFSTSDPLSFPVGKAGIYRKVQLLVNQTSFDNVVEYEAELFAGAPPARTLPGTFTNINEQWYHTITITEGNAFFSDATATIFYEASDGVSNAAALRIGKDDGGSNWLDIGGVGTATPAGSITSSSFSSFSDFVLANLSGPLPVTLLHFNGNHVNNSVQLNWQVENEINLARYQVERSTDGISFTVIGTVVSRASATSNAYNFDDKFLPASETIYYRLKMADVDGRYKYSNIIRLALNGLVQNKIVVSPNPVTSRFTLQYQSPVNEQVQLQLLDMKGSIVKQQYFRVSKGVNQLYIETGHLPSGTYLLKLLVNTGVINQKIIKQ
jgi:Secretion system C-terminal sorting domain